MPHAAQELLLILGIGKSLLGKAPRAIVDQIEREALRIIDAASPGALIALIDRSREFLTLRHKLGRLDFPAIAIGVLASSARVFACDSRYSRSRADNARGDDLADLDMGFRLFDGALQIRAPEDANAPIVR